MAVIGYNSYVLLLIVFCSDIRNLFVVKLYRY
jgi:hypothetical protein